MAAEEMLRHALACSETVHGPHHITTGSSANELAILLSAKGELDEAEGLTRRALAIFEAALGPDHPHTVASLSNLATVYEAMEQAERAAAMHSLVAVHKSTWDEKQKQAAKRR